MDFSYTEREEGFRRELSEWLRQNLPPGAPDGGRWAFQALFALRFAIAGGATEIQKNVIGERLLGLPKG